MRWRSSGVGIGPVPASMFSFMCLNRLVAGIAQVIAGWLTMHFSRKSV